MANFQERIAYAGGQSVSSLGGQIKLSEVSGTLTIFDPVTRQPRNIQDINGTHIFDNQGREATTLNTLGLTTTEPATGIQRTRVGVASSDGRAIVATTKSGIDLRSQGI